MPPPLNWWLTRFSSDSAGVGKGTYCHPSVGYILVDMHLACSQLACQRPVIAICCGKSNSRGFGFSLAITMQKLEKDAITITLIIP